MATSAWRDRRRPSTDAPLAEGIHFGARPGWEPGREGSVTDLALRDPMTGDLVVEHEGVCYLCHDGIDSARMPDLIVCGACGRYSAERALDKVLEEFPPPPADTPAERARWEVLPDHVKYPDRRPTPPKRDAGIDPDPAELAAYLHQLQAPPSHQGSLAR